MLQVGDAVRVVPGTGSGRLLEEWSDLTGKVHDLSDDGSRLWVLDEGPLPGFGMVLPTADFTRDTPLDAAPTSAQAVGGSLNPGIR